MLVSSRLNTLTLPQGAAKSNHYFLQFYEQSLEVLMRNFATLLPDFIHVIVPKDILLSLTTTTLLIFFL